MLFGGYRAEPALIAPSIDLDDTWTFDGTSWTEMTGAKSPPAREDAAMATLADEVVLFGGTAQGSIYMDDTWTFDGTRWSQLPVPKSPPAGGAMAALP